jgi:2-C-methyl-D-erythritol 4-phosphate cytidylyltransferase
MTQLAFDLHKCSNILKKVLRNSFSVTQTPQFFPHSKIKREFKGEKEMLAISYQYEGSEESHAWHAEKMKVKYKCINLKIP